ncbi:MAG: CBS domain-containing protein [Oxalobacteraceae bacterium]|nr:MAG: CBS domain-containing protein [Oxalobacteraceae bacterium]
MGPGGAARCRGPPRRRHSARRDALLLLTAEMHLDEALRQFMRHHGERLPVIDSMTGRILVGAVHKTDLLDAYVRLNRSASTEVHA